MTTMTYRFHVASRVHEKSGFCSALCSRAPPVCLQTDIFSFGSYWHEGGPRVCTHAGHYVMPLAESPCFRANSRPFRLYCPSPPLPPPALHSISSPRSINGEWGEGGREGGKASNFTFTETRAWSSSSVIANARIIVLFVGSNRFRRRRWTLKLVQECKWRKFSSFSFLLLRWG